MKKRTRGNGQGSAYKRGRTWEAQIIIGFRPPADASRRPIPIKRRKGGFSTKKEALAWCITYTQGRNERPKLPLSAVYEQWSEKYAPRVGTSTMAGYRAAYKHFAVLHPRMIASITAQDLQDCMDVCPAGKRTHQLMRVTAGLIWAYALDADYVDKDVTANLYTGRGESVQREPLTEAEVDAIRAAIGTEPYADYVYALCYLGFRPGEFLALRKSDYHVDQNLAYLTGGSKTEAGRDRRVPVPAQIMDILQRRLDTPGTDLLFPMLTYSRKADHAFTGYKQMSDAYFRELVFKPLMARLGIAPGKVPYCARHTYSDKLKSAAGDDKAKAAIMGHTDYDFTRKRYQSTTLDDIRDVANSIK